MAQIFDPSRIFRGLKTAISEGVTSVFPIETEGRQLVVKNVRVDDSNVSPFDYKTQKQIKIQEKDFVVPVYGDLELVDKNTGEVIDTKKNFRLMDIPVLTDRYSYILGGNEYTVDKQLRMKPGIYTREKENGELESQFNLAKGGGRGFKMWINPEDGIFKLKIGTANPPLYPLLKALGVEDGPIKEAWGDSMFTLNQAKTRRTGDVDIMKAYKAIFRKDAAGLAQAQTELRNFFDKTVLSEETTKRTLGKGFAKVEPETLLLTSKRLLEVSRGEAEPDDRDSLVYKHLYDTPDLIKARLDANQRKVQNDIKRVMDKKNKITEIVSKDMLNKPVRQFFVQGTVAHAAEQTNPTTMLAEATKVTSLGEGAIGDMNAITDSMRAVNTSHVGVLDPVATPESDRIGINLHLALGATVKDKELQTLVVDPTTRKSRYENVKDIFDLKVAFPDQYDKDNKPVKGTVTIIQKGKITEVDPKEVDLVLRSPKQMFTYLTNLVPFSANIQGNRAFMANKMLAQAIPLKYREAPLVQSKMPTGGTFENFIGKVFSTQAEEDGVVKKVTYDEVIVENKDGKESVYNLYNNFPLNNKSFIHSTPLVKAGDKVTLGQPIADTNYTKDGTLAIGTNLRVGILPFKDSTFEDGYVISESASKKLTSEHLREVTIQVGKEDLMELKAFKAHYPTAMTGDMAGKLDESGVIKKGTVVEPGDVVIAHLQKTEASDEDARLGKLSKKLVKGYRNNAQIWDKETIGTVVDVFKTPDSIKVFIRTEEPMQIGDKIVNRHGAKGIVSCYDEKTEVLTDSGWKPFSDLKYSDKICTLNPDTGIIEYHQPTNIIAEDYCGPMHKYCGRRLNFMTTPNHKHYVGKRYSKAKPKLETSDDIFGKSRLFYRTGQWVGTELERITIPGATYTTPTGKVVVKEALQFDAGDFMEFFGFYITEGHCSKNSGVVISQSKEKHFPEWTNIKESMSRLGFKIGEDAFRLTLYSVQIRHWLKQFGYSQDKFIPREMLDASPRLLKRMYDAIMQGDGRLVLREDGSILREEIYTSSKRLADDYQELALRIGKSASIGIYVRHGVPEYIVRVSNCPVAWKVENNTNNHLIEYWEKYRGKVYCATVPNHIMYVRRCGKPMWSGNSIVPDNEMPINKEGARIDVAISPSAIPGRINPSQVLETAASKVALKWGRPLKIDNFAPIDSVKEIKNLLKTEGLTDKEELVDPKTGQSLGKVMVGNQYYLKLMHQVSKKINARGAGPSYDIDMQPTKGGHGSARAMDRLTWNSLVAHGARENLYEMTAYKAEKNPELWNSVRMGLPIPAPKRPFVFDKLLGYLAAGGVNVKKDGNKLYMLPLTDQEILGRSNGEIDDAKVVISKNLRPVQDGLFDEVKTGGLKGNKWTHVKLAEPVLNPVMENAAMTLLDLTQNQLEDVIAGRRYYDPATGSLTNDNTGITSGAALEKMLSKINVDEEFKSLKDSAATLKGQGLNKANKKLRFLNALRLHNLSPDKAYMIHNVPILPPQFRPMYPLPNGSLNTAPINYLYRDMIMVNKQLKELSDLDDDVKSDLRRDLYQSIKAAQGLGDPLVQRGEKKIIGAIELIKGSQPKEGFFQSVVFSKNQDLSGSSTITPSVEMSPDEILLPKDMAWELYQPFVIKELTSMGYKPLDAMVMAKDHDPRANLALEKVTRERPVWLNRAPSLHKFSMLAVQPKLYNGKSIGIHPLVVGGFTADIDGNCSDFDSLIKLKISKSAIDIISSAVYIKRNLKYKELFMRTVAESTLSWKTSDSVVVTTKIGEFPRIGFPSKDRNGADVYAVPDGVEVVGCDPVTGEANYYPVTLLTVEEGCQTVEVFFGGRSVILSDNESMAAFNSSTGAVTKVAPSNVDKMMVPVLKKDPTPFGTFGTRDIGWMLGAYISDGWTSSNTVGYAKLEKAKRDEFVRIMRACHDNFTVREYHGEAGDGKLGTSIKLHLNSMSLVEYMRQFNCIADSDAQVRTSNKKKIPHWVLQLGSEDMLWGLLSGLIDGDGSMSINMSTGRPRFTAKFCTSSPFLRDSVKELCYRLGIRADVTTVPPRNSSSEAYVVNLSTVDLFEYLDNLSCIGERERSIISQWKECPPAKDDRDLIPVSDAEVATLKSFVSSVMDASLHTAISRNKKVGYRVGRKILERHLQIMDEHIPSLAARVRARNTVWETVTEVKDAGVRQVFDLAVEEAKVYAVNNGIIIWDTMGVYVPVSHKAVEEAKNYFPTKVLEHAADGRIMVSPGHDIMTGLFYLTRSGKDRTKEHSFSSIDDAMKLYKNKTIEIYDDVMIGGKKTTIGRELVSKALPSGIVLPEGGLSKSTIKSFLSDLASAGPAKFNETMTKLSQLSAQFNIYSAISIGLDDLEPDYAARDKMVKSVQNKLKSAKDDDERRKIIQSSLPEFHNTVTDYMKSHPESALSQLMKANGKPSFDQFKQLISTPFAVSDADGRAIPIITTKSFAEGLPVSEYWTTTYGSRTGMIQKRLETAEPGYFSKQILSVTIDNVVSMDDCGTSNGVATSMESKNDVVGRYEAGTNNMIDVERYTSMLKNGVKTVKLRSPLTCEAKEGTCSKCYGLRENGQQAKIGDNVGALAGQFFTEPTTQGALKAFHTGAVLGAGAQVAGGLERLQQLTMVPDYLKDKATLAKVSGTIDRIEDNPAGGKNIFIGSEKHLAGVRNKIIVSAGDTVSKGDALTDGPIKPQELLELKGIEPTQKYLVDSMKETFAGMGVELNRKLLETVVKSTTNLTTIADAGDHPYYVPGDQVPLSEVKSWNSKRQNEMDVDMALGATLAVGTGPYSTGTVLDRDKIKALKTLGINTVTISSSPVKHTPSIVGVNLLARMGKDWLAKLNTNYIEQGIIKGVQTGDVATTSSYNPTGPYVLATGFGKGEKGKY